MLLGFFCAVIAALMCLGVTYMMIQLGVTMLRNHRQEEGREIWSRLNFLFAAALVVVGAAVSIAVILGIALFAKGIYDYIF